MTRLLVGSITNLGHRQLTFETTTNAVINTLGFTPAFSDFDVTIGLVSLELVGSLLDNRLRVDGFHHFVFSIERRKNNRRTTEEGSGVSEGQKRTQKDDQGFRKDNRRDRNFMSSDPTKPPVRTRLATLKKPDAPLSASASNIPSVSDLPEQPTKPQRQFTPKVPTTRRVKKEPTADTKQAPRVRIMILLIF